MSLNRSMGENPSQRQKSLKDTSLTKRQLLKAIGLGTSLALIGSPETTNAAVSRDDRNPKPSPGISIDKDSDLPVNNPEHTISVETKEIEARGLQIIDNTGIRADDGIFDLSVDKEKLIELIRLIAQRTIREQFWPVVDEMIGQLTISFGAKDFDETLATAFRKSNGDISVTKKTSMFVQKKLGMNSNRVGFFSNYEGRPFIGIFSGKLVNNNSNYRILLTLFHELTHFVCSADPDMVESQTEKFFQNLLISLGLTIPPGSALGTALAFASDKKVKTNNIIDFFRNNKNLIAFRSTIASYLFAIPAIVKAEDIHYQHLDKDENIARNNTVNLAQELNQSDLDQIIKVHFH